MSLLSHPCFHPARFHPAAAANEPSNPRKCQLLIDVVQTDCCACRKFECLLNCRCCPVVPVGSVPLSGIACRTVDSNSLSDISASGTSGGSEGSGSCLKSFHSMSLVSCKGCMHTSSRMPAAQFSMLNCKTVALVPLLRPQESCRPF